MHFLIYSRYWDPVMKKTRPNGSPMDRLTFSEFIWYLTHTPERDYHERWTPYWNRCDPCLVDYDFIGKIETAKHDFPYAFNKVGIGSSSDWWDNIEQVPRSLTLRYFSTVSQEAILKLHQIYKLDFDLFGYSINEFVIGNRTHILWLWLFRTNNKNFHYSQNVRSQTVFKAFVMEIMVSQKGSEFF